MAGRKYLQNKKIKHEKEQELEQMLEDYFSEMIMDLNLRLLADMERETGMDEQILWVERITLTEVGYPDIPDRRSFRQKIKSNMAALWKRIKFW